MDGEVRLRSVWERKPLVSSLRLASSSRVSPFWMRSCLILWPISKLTPRFLCAVILNRKVIFTKPRILYNILPENQ